MFPTNTQEIVTATQANAAWHLALETAYDRALMAYPQEGKRIRGALALIQQGGVQVHGKYLQVPSQSTNGKLYDVDESCACSWFTYGALEGQRRRCTHRWAYLLYAHALDRFVSLYAALYRTRNAEGALCDLHGFAQPFPEDSGYLFVSTEDGSHRFLPAPCSNLTLLGKVAWIEEGVLCGAIPQAVKDMQPRA